MPKTIILSNRLPISIVRKGNRIRYKVSDGGLATGLSSVYRSGNNLWMGWPGGTVPEEEKKMVEHELISRNMAPVFLSNSEYKSYYLGFSNQTLWPAFHYFPQHIVYDDNYWNTYRQVNEKFALEILKHYKTGDKIWVHDYQLLLVPSLLRELCPEAVIGFFLHIPFPAYEIFRLLPWRSELLEGMLGADLIAFHTSADKAYFNHCVTEILNCKRLKNVIQFNKRNIHVESIPMSIDYEKFVSNALHPLVRRKIREFKESLKVEKIILSVDRLDYSKGLLKRLSVFEQFLDQNPEFKERVSFILIVVPSRDKVPSYQRLKEQIDEIVGRINGRYTTINWSPIHYFYRSYSFRSLGAFYRMSDVCMVTPLRDGMNLVCKEYVTSRVDCDGVLILSEMAGAAKELTEAILVNPNNSQEMVNALCKALNMGKNEQRRRMKLLQENIRAHDVHNWVSIFFSRLSEAEKAKRVLEKSSLLDTRMEKSLFKNYKRAKRRLILLDYDGTLIPFNTNPFECQPDRGILHLLEKLVSDENNEVVLISGRSKQELDLWFKIEGIHLVAEHGFLIRLNGLDWVSKDTSDQSWREVAIQALHDFVARIPGSFIEVKQHAIAYHYRGIENGIKSKVKLEVFSHFQELFYNSELELLQGQDVFEIKSAGYSKGKAAKDLVKYFSPEFIVCIGDDVTDESMFEELPDWATTIKVGRGQTAARFRLKDYAMTREFLERLSACVEIQEKRLADASH